jgi:hypothetical protein
MSRRVFVRDQPFQSERVGQIQLSQFPCREFSGSYVN